MDDEMQKELVKTGWLLKWTTYLKGYKKRWFVLCSGVLSYYKDPSEVPHTCRGRVDLVEAVIHTAGSKNFVIYNGLETLHLKGASKTERQQWITALEVSKARAIRLKELDRDRAYNALPAQDAHDLSVPLELLRNTLEQLSTCQELIHKDGGDLQDTLLELENIDTLPDDTTIKDVNEKVEGFLITSTAMINACQDHLQLVQNNSSTWEKMLQHDDYSQIKEVIENLAQQQRWDIEKSKIHLGEDLGYEDVEDDNKSAESVADTLWSDSGFSSFRRALSRFSWNYEDHDDNGATPSHTSEIMVSKESRVIGGSKKSERTAALQDKIHPPSTSSTSEYYSVGTSSDLQNRLMMKKRRTLIPEKLNRNLNFFLTLRNCIGRESSMPICFHEPISLLQRFTEEYEYSNLLDKASKCSDSCEQMLYIAAFCVSAYASTSNRIGKPFNPLLGETYECDRTDDYGWRCVSEQVSHHPPVSAQHCEGRGWVCCQEFNMQNKFSPTCLQITPLGIAHLEFRQSGNHYTWKKVTTFVHYTVFGTCWIDHGGEMKIVNHSTKDQCHLKFTQCQHKYFAKEIPRKVTGSVTDRSGSIKWFLQGTWDYEMQATRVLDDRTEAKGKPRLETGTFHSVWKRNESSDEYEKIYNFTQLACQLNEPESGVAPTDSRLRPDVRLMEDGAWDEASRIKILLEEKQRDARKRRERQAERAVADGQPYQPHETTWFRKGIDPTTGNPFHMFTGEYWECKEKLDWARCPDIFL